MKLLIAAAALLTAVVTAAAAVYTALRAGAALEDPYDPGGWGE